MSVAAGPLRYLLFCTICAGTFAAGTAGGLLHDDHRVREGVFVEQVHLGGLTRAEALTAVESYAEPLLPAQIELRHGTRRWNLHNQKFGRQVEFSEAVDEAYAVGREGTTWDRAAARLSLSREAKIVPLRVELDRDRLESLLGEVSQVVDREPRDARVSAVIGGRPYFQPEQDGLKLKILATADAVVGEHRFPPQAQVSLAVESLPAKVRVAELRDGLTTVLASHTTSMSHGYHGVMRVNRAHNVRLLLERMNGKILMPGDEWSFNGDLGERRAEDGFKSSIIFIGRPDGTIEERWSTGGGICQLATTLFNAVLYANLEITERSNHSKTVHYAKPARDATVYYGLKDLRFRNSLEHPILLWGELRPNLDLVISIIGNAADQTEVELDSNFWYGRAGKGGSLWRTAKSMDGEMLQDRVHVCDSFYPYGKSASVD